MTTDALPFQTEWCGQVLLLQLQGDLLSLTPEDYADVIEHLLPMIQDRSNPCVVVDAARVDKADSTLLALLVLLWKQMTALGGRMALAGLHPAFQNVLQCSKLDTVWDVYPSRNDAIAAVNR